MYKLGSHFLKNKSDSYLSRSLVSLRTLSTELIIFIVRIFLLIFTRLLSFSKNIISYSYIIYQLSLELNTIFFLWQYKNSWYSRMMVILSFSKKTFSLIDTTWWKKFQCFLILSFSTLSSGCFFSRNIWYI